VKFVRVNRVLLKALVEKAEKLPELHELALAVNRACVYDEGCAALEYVDRIAYKNVTDE